MSKIPELFGTMVFNDATMREKLPKDIYKELQNTIRNGESLNSSVANAVANAMKDWAVEKGATHFTHWFLPMTGITAEKHESFISPTGDGGVIMEFSGKELIKGESDASSFPSGGLRATFEARGYTAWDPTSYAFIKDGTLCIPTAFCSYGGEALDKKTPLLRSMEAINIQAKRILKLFGKDVARVTPTVGAEQEYFLIDKDVYAKRKDLIYCGRTLFGAPAPKGQELDDHYYGQIKPRVSAFMKELDEELWRLGILAKTKHNEAAPAQHELAPLFTSANIAADNNQLMMEMMKIVAARHGMVCLLHEKPFEGVNGSGKHNNWSLSTSAGENLLEPGKSPYENAQFLIFLCAVIGAVHKHQDLLRISSASAGNDHRLGAHEAPPAIISMFIGDELEEVLKAIRDEAEYEGKKKVKMTVGVSALPRISRDNTDRNRTSPFAFTGNKFEFRSVGSNDSIGCANIMLNTIVADELEAFADVLEKSDNFIKDVHELVKKTMTEHDAIIFGGNGYSEEWVKEAEKRGLLNLRTAVDAFPHYIKEENIKMFEHHKIYTGAEVHARYEILMEEYSKVINIEALSMIGMVKKDYIPSVSQYITNLCDAVSAKQAVCESISAKTEKALIEKLSSALDNMFDQVTELEDTLKGCKETNATERAVYFKNKIVPLMEALRKTVDGAEVYTDRQCWPVPSYGDVIFSVK